MHIKKFAALDIGKHLTYVEDAGGFFYLMNSDERDAVFSVEGYIEYVRLCPSLERFGYVCRRTWLNIYEVPRTFDKPSRFTQEIKLTGGNNASFADCVKGVERVVDFINVQRAHKGYVMLYEDMENTIKASTPLLAEPDKVLFHAENCDIPRNLPAYRAIRAEVVKKRARYTTENNVLLTEGRSARGEMQWV
jgi:hypothetical protein